MTREYGSPDSNDESDLERVEDPLSRYHGLSTLDAVEFFKEMAPEATCAVCGHDDLKIHSGVGLDSEGNSEPEPGRFAVAGVVVHEIPSQRAQMKLAALTTSCTRCGYLMHFLIERILEWKQRHDSDQ